MVTGRRSKKNTILILSSVFLISFVLMTVNIKSSKGPVFFETLIFWIINPFQNAVTHAVQSITKLVDHYFLLVNVSRKNEALRNGVDRLVRENNQLQEQLLQQKRLSRLIGDPGKMKLNFVSAVVVGRDATQWSKVVFINKGTQDGLRKNFAVVSNRGIIGHVIQVGSHTSKVLLINDSRSGVDALFQESRVFGVVVGTGGDICDMKYVPIDAGVHEGDKVVSSGMGGIFPKGWVVGTVSQVIKRKQGLFQEITIKPGADLTRLEEVLVLTP